MIAVLERRLELAEAPLELALNLLSVLEHRAQARALGRALRAQLGQAHVRGGQLPPDAIELDLRRAMLGLELAGPLLDLTRQRLRLHRARLGLAREPVGLAPRRLGSIGSLLALQR